MATKCEAWRASTDNSLHPTEKAATEHDLDVFVRRHARPNSLNLAKNIGQNADEAIRLLQAWLKAHPGEGGGKLPSEGRKGPTAMPKPAPDTRMACCGFTFAECECDDARVAAQVTLATGPQEDPWFGDKKCGHPPVADATCSDPWHHRPDPTTSQCPSCGERDL